MSKIRVDPKRYYRVSSLNRNIEFFFAEKETAVEAAEAMSLNLPDVQIKNMFNGNYMGRAEDGSFIEYSTAKWEIK